MHRDFGQRPETRFDYGFIPDVSSDLEVGRQLLDVAGHDECFSRARVGAALLFDRNTKAGADADLTFDDQCGMVLIGDPFCKCKPQPGATHLAAAGRVNAVEALKKAR